jgi:hypothetical protein
MRACIIFILAFSVSLFAVTHRTYSLSGGFATLYDGVGRDWDGNIYIGGGNSSAYDAALFKFNFTSNSFDIVAQVKQVSQAQSNWLSNDYAGKIHTSVKQGMDGKMYFASHRAEDNTAYQPGYRGGHFYSYDPGTGSAVDISAPGVGADSQGIMDIALGLQHDYVYGVDENKMLWRQNVVTHEHNFIWDSGSETRNIFSDNRGRLISPTSFGRLLFFEPRRAPLQDTVYISRLYGTTFTTTCKRIPAVVKSWSGDSIYFIGKGGSTGGEHVWRYIVSLDAMEDFGLVDPGNTTASAFALALRWDLNRLYMVVGSRLVSYNVLTRARRSEYSGFSGTLSGSNGVDKDGNLWFTQKHTSNTVHKFTLDEAACAVCTQKPAYLDSSVLISVEQKAPGKRTDQLRLSVNPNPVQTGALFAFQAEKAVRLAVYDINGRVLQAWKFRNHEGPGAVRWSAKDMTGRPLSNGIYLVKLHAGKREKSVRLTIMK